MNVLVLGAGQLARMMALASKPLNVNVRAYDVGSRTVVDPLNLAQSYGDLAEGIAFADAITAEFEHIAHDVLAQCEASGKLHPSSQAIKTGGDRRLEKGVLEQCGVANAQHKIITTEQDFADAISELGLPLILKSALAGYDGKGQWRIKDASQAADIWKDIEAFFAGANEPAAQAVVAEQMVPFDREVSLVGARDAKGNTQVYPLVENHHTDGVLTVTVALAQNEALTAQAKAMFDKVADALNYVGVLAIEFFQVGEQLLVNEIAPRVHNSGHWTQQGADTCQFENHIRATTGMPLGSGELVRPTAMINILGEDEVPSEVLSVPSVHLHWYGKGKRAGRKMGHINLSADTNKALVERLYQVAQLLPSAAFEDIQQYAAELAKKY
ncbi:5-(carboxyamino)imidazole ribonucleotide synthase [Thalassotalea euphylliae]|uniref:5-(carboxyamino)imidazole ribonucleotide synthase n=1 Tax=Thalassotalea euphylliae TaxID=1655234 RepID=UPI0036280E8D